MYDEAKRNHYLQQQCIDEIWTDKLTGFDDYKKGVQHDGALIGISVTTVLASAGRENLWPQLKTMCTHYGIALQLLDDISEAEEDRVLGYNSYPVMEGRPFSDSFARVEYHISAARKFLHPEWREFGELFKNVLAVKKELVKRFQ